MLCQWGFYRETEPLEISLSFLTKKHKQRYWERKREMLIIRNWLYMIIEAEKPYGLETQENRCCSSILSLKAWEPWIQTMYIPVQGKEKLYSSSERLSERAFSLPLPLFYSVLNGLKEVHLLWGGKSTWLSLLSLEIPEKKHQQIVFS